MNEQGADNQQYKPGIENMRVTAGNNRDHSNGKQGVCNKGHVGPEGIWQNARVSVEPEEYFLIRALRRYSCCQNKQ